MKILFTQEALQSLEEAMEFISPKVSFETLQNIRNKILNRTDKLAKNPLSGKKEEYLQHLGLDHRRLVESHYKIIYRVMDQTT